MAGRVGIVNYGMGNVKSVYNAIDYLGEDVVLLEPKDDFATCSHLILPGVGSYSKAMENIVSLGIDLQLEQHVACGKPLLGICLGMQLFSSVGSEGGEKQGLGFINGRIAKLDVSLHIPHVGWNSLNYHQEHPVFDHLKADIDFYFVHSFQFQLDSSTSLLATTDYEKKITAVVSNHKSVVGVQFHPEKSQGNGLTLLENFCEWDGRI